MKHKLVSPDGFYTAQEAATELGLSTPTFYRYCRNGKLKMKKVGEKEGLYRVSDVYTILRQRESEKLLHSTAPVTFKCVTEDWELGGIVDLCIPIFGRGDTPTLEQRRDCWEANPQCYYVMIQDDIVIAYVTMTPVSNLLLNKLMKPANETRGELYKGLSLRDHVLPFTLGTPIPHMFISMSVRFSLEHQEFVFRGKRLLREWIQILCDLKHGGSPIGMLYARSKTGDGQRAARHLGMHETRYDGDDEFAYELDPELSTCRAFKPYRETRIHI